MLAGVLSVVAAFAYTCGLALQQKANLETPPDPSLAATVRRVARIDGGSVASDDAVEAVRQVKGLGPFAAELVVVRGANAPDAAARVRLSQVGSKSDVGAGTPVLRVLGGTHARDQRVGMNQLEPTLETERLRLRSGARRDLEEDLAAVGSDPTVCERSLLRLVLAQRWHE